MLEAMIHRLKACLRDEDGPTAVEYALMVSLIAGAVISSVGQVSLAMKNSYNSSATAINAAMAP